MARERLLRAKRHEVEAHERAIASQESAAKRQDEAGQPDLAAAARHRAEHARQLRDLAIQELKELES